MFTIRTTKPSNNPYYITTDKGGYSWAIKGSPTDSTANVLANCVGYANGRFAEIMAEETGEKGIKYQLVCNAENFIEKAKNYGLKISSKPTLGGIMVWQKGTLSSSDGAGHVAVVERLNKDGSIYISESGWGASRPFWNSTRTNSNGRWGQGSGYTFRGCIINPAVKDEPTIKIVGVPVPRNKSANQLEVITDTLRARKEPNLKATVLGYAKQGIYNVLNTKEADGYIWYQIDEFWCANDKDATWCHYLPKEYVGKPVERNTDVNQLKVITKTLRARKDPNLNGEILGYVNTGIYDVHGITEAEGYTWYQVEDFWCANNKDATWCEYLPKIEKRYNIEIYNLRDTQKDIAVEWAQSIYAEFKVTEL